VGVDVVPMPKQHAINMHVKAPIGFMFGRRWKRKFIFTLRPPDCRCPLDRRLDAMLLVDIGVEMDAELSFYHNTIRRVEKYLSTYIHKLNSLLYRVSFP